MKRLLLALAALISFAATPQEVLPGLESNGYHIEEGSGATESVVSDAVFDGRADGGRLYIVVLAEEPPGGATTFSDSVLDLLGEGYVVTVAPDTVGFAGDGTFWTADEMNEAIDASLEGGTDDEVVEIFASALVDGDAGVGDPSSEGGGISVVWVLVIGAGLLGLWWFATNRNRGKRLAGRMDQVKEVARQKLDEVANDILEMEDEVSVSDNAEVKAHYQRASGMYTQAMEDTERATTVQEMLEVSTELDMAIWELDCAEALLDGKPVPPKPEPPPPQPVLPPSPSEGHGEAGSTSFPSEGFDRRPQRQSSGSNDLMTMLLTMMAMGGMRGGGGFGGPSGGWTGSGGGTPKFPMGGGGRIRGGGRRRG